VAAPSALAAVPTALGPEAVDAAAGEPRRDADGAGADELVAGTELPATAEDEDDVTGALGSELVDAVGPATCGRSRCRRSSTGPPLQQAQ